MIHVPLMCYKVRVVLEGRRSYEMSEVRQAVPSWARRANTSWSATSAAIVGRQDDESGESSACDKI